MPKKVANIQSTENIVVKSDNQFHPAPGFIFARPLKREELNSGAFSLPDNASNIHDSVGIAEVIECGQIRTINGELEWTGVELAVGDLVGHMPYTDAIIEIDLKKYSILPYDKIWAVRKGQK